MRLIKMKITLLALAVGAFSPALAVDIVSGTAAADQVFSQNLTGKAFDRYTGTFFVGAAAATVPTGNTIAKAGRGDSVFTGLSTGANQANFTVVNTNAATQRILDVASDDGTSAKYVAFRHTAANTEGTLSGVSVDGAADTFKTTADQILNSANAATAALAISAVAGGYYEKPAAWAGAATGAYFFVRSRAHVTTDFTTNGGILALRVNDAGNAFEIVGRNVVNAAVKYDGVTGTAAGDGAAKRFDAAAGGNLVAGTNVVQDMYWDQTLQTLFVASELTTIDGTDGEKHFYMAISKVKFKNDANEKIVISDVIPAAVNPPSANDTTIFASSKLDAAAGLVGTHSPRIYKIRTMHTSTGKTYLVVNGKVAAVDGDVNGNAFYALRYDPDAAATIVDGGTGQIVANTVAGTVLTADFTLETDNVGDLSKRLDGGNAGSLVIGGAVAPWPETAAASDMEVVGDTVYVSFAAANRDATNDPGVWASSAQFDKDGVIIGWTSWERVMPSQGATFNDRTDFFAVDAMNNKLWAVTQTAANTPNKVVRHNWETTGFVATTLPGTINTSFGANAYSDVTCTLDIPMNVPGVTHVHIAADSLTSLAMLGGYEKVDFAKTSVIAAANVNAVAQAPTTDFSVVNMYVQTTLAGAGTVRSLAASRCPVALQGYFFAGTDTGLYVWAITNAAKNAQEGYDGTAAINAIIAAPFNPAAQSWQPMMDAVGQISGPVTAMDSDGVYLYLIEQDVSSASGTLISKLWRITIGVNVDAMETTAIVIAQSGKDEIPANAIFTDFKIITDINGNRANRAADAGARCILSTDLGLYYPSQPLDKFVDANVAGATPNAPHKWYVKHVDEVFPSVSLFAPKRVPATVALAGASDGICHKVIASGLIDDTRGLGYFQNSELRQVNADSAILFPYLDTINYTNNSMATGTTALTYLNNRALRFWTDGGRRFYTRRDVANSYGNAAEFKMLNSLPYNAQEWNMTEPYGDDAIKGQTIYWVESISGLGIILAGTPNGVIALQ